MLKHAKPSVCFFTEQFLRGLCHSSFLECEQCEGYKTHSKRISGCQEKTTIDTFQINILNTTVHHITTNICDFSFSFQMVSDSVTGHSDVLVSVGIFLVWISVRIFFSQKKEKLLDLPIVKRSLFPGHPGFSVSDGQTICQHSLKANDH